MKSFSVIRTHRSPYHAENFEQIERHRLGRIPGISFCELNQVNPEQEVILITNTHTLLRELPGNLLNKTRLIIHSNSGYDQFAQDSQLIKNIPIVVGHTIRAQAVAEYGLNCIMTGLAELPQHLAWNKSRNWERPLIRDQKVLVFGAGHIGKIVIGALRALGAEVKVVDPFVPGNLKSWEDTDLAQYRIVIACCGLNSTSRHLFNEAFFEKAHSELIFINGARGKLVKESALREFLLTHPKAQAFLDVFEKEPFDESWHSFPQVWKTSHIAGVYSELDEAIIQFEEKTLRDFITLDEQSFQARYKDELLQNKWIQGELI